jgi:hypothetical protein
VNLPAVPGGEAIAAARIGADGEADSLVVLHRRIEVPDAKIGAICST